MDQNQWIRGVNIGGWLLAERFITPYLFAVNSCHLQGDLCWYPGQVGAPENATICSSECKPIHTVFTSDSNADFHPRKSHNFEGYPIDELTLGQAFVNKEIGQKYMERHWDTFVTREDLVRLKEAGVTHMRVPMSYWIRGDIQAGESWIPGGWPYFVRFAKWSREIGLEIWADLHGKQAQDDYVRVLNICEWRGCCWIFASHTK
jgi:glucan 1,3-beta-glucosidase